MRRVRLSWITAVLVALGVVFATAGCNSPVDNTDIAGVRQRVLAALKKAGYDSYDLRWLRQRDAEFTILAGDSDWLQGWVIVDALNKYPVGRTPMEPVRVTVGLSPKNELAIISNDPGAFCRMVAGNGEVTTAESAIAEAEIYLDYTANGMLWYQRVESVDDIKMHDSGDEQQIAAKERVIAEYSSEISPPHVVKDDFGWSFTMWTVRGDRHPYATPTGPPPTALPGGNLVRHEFTIAPDGTLQDEQTIEVEHLPTPVVLGI